MLSELIIKVDNREIHLGPHLTVPIRQSNIPFEHCQFRSHEAIFWKVELLEYNPETKCWKMKVLDYFTRETENFKRQKSTREVERIAFEKFDWPSLEQHLSNYQKSKLLDQLENQDADRFFREEMKLVRIPAFAFGDTLSGTESRVDEPQAPEFEGMEYPVPKIIRLEFSVSLEDVYFKLGYVAFKKYIREVGGEVEFKIKNDHVLAEFEHIKSWFARKLKTKKFRVLATVTLADGEVTEVFASSPQFAMINATLVDSVKYQRTMALIKSPKILETDKSLFTSEEIFRTMDSEDVEGNVFDQNEQDILRFLLENHKTRNRKQLEYLSGSKQSERFKLRFTLYPNFGFLFFIEGEENNHFVWELLNSHATYIWSMGKSEQDIELQYKRIGASINSIRDSGREQYKRAYRQNHIDDDLVFSVIDHNSITSELVDGFVKWKHRLNERIT
ncbi:MAG TPA: hypothetical protein DIW47_08000 [Bacteroidetes bacterium]|nr:hypothetical protein [Bacteroidota bacterium]